MDNNLHIWIKFTARFTIQGRNQFSVQVFQRITARSHGNHVMLRVYFHQHHQRYSATPGCLKTSPAGTGSLQRSSEGLANVTAPWFRCKASVPPVKPQLESSWLLALFQWTCQFSGPHLCKHLEQTFSPDVSYSPFMWLKLAGEEIRVLDLGCGFLSMLPLLLEQLVPAGVASMIIHDHGRYTRWCPPVVKRWFIFFFINQTVVINI